MTGRPIEHWNRPSFLSAPLAFRLKHTLLTDRKSAGFGIVGNMAAARVPESWLCDSD